MSTKNTQLLNEDTLLIEHLCPEAGLSRISPDLATLPKDTVVNDILKKIGYRLKMMTLCSGEPFTVDKNQYPYVLTPNIMHEFVVDDISSMAKNIKTKIIKILWQGVWNPHKERCEGGSIRLRVIDSDTDALLVDYSGRARSDDDSPVVFLIEKNRKSINKE